MTTGGAGSPTVTEPSNAAGITGSGIITGSGGTGTNGTSGSGAGSTSGTGDSNGSGSGNNQDAASQSENPEVRLQNYNRNLQNFLVYWRS